jgi:hypothetical protein
MRWKRSFVCGFVVTFWTILPSETYRYGFPIPHVFRPRLGGKCMILNLVRSDDNHDDTSCRVQQRRRRPQLGTFHHPWGLFLSKYECRTELDHDAADDDAAVRMHLTKEFNHELSRWCQLQCLDDAYQLLVHTAENGTTINGRTVNATHFDRESYSILLRAIAALGNIDVHHLELADDIFQRMVRHPSIVPTRMEYAALILAWSKSNDHRAAERCASLLHDNWLQYNKTTTGSDQDKLDISPSHSSYVSTMTAIARSGGGKRAAERTEALLEDMERRSHSHGRMVHLQPTTTCVNIVLYVHGYCCIYIYMRISYCCTINWLTRHAVSFLLLCLFRMMMTGMLGVEVVHEKHPKDAKLYYSEWKTYTLLVEPNSNPTRFPSIPPWIASHSHVIPIQLWMRSNCWIIWNN